MFALAIYPASCLPSAQVLRVKASGAPGTLFHTYEVFYMRSVRRLWSYLWTYKLLVILAPLMMALEVAMDLMQPRLIQRIIDEGVAVNDLDVVIETGALMVGLSILGMIAGVLCGVFAIRAGQGFGADVRAALFSKVQSLSFGNLDRLETGSLITRLTTDITQLTDAVIMMLRIMVRAPLLLIGSLILGIATSPHLALLFVVLLPVILLIIGVIFSRAFPLFKAVQERLDRINSIMEENLQGVRVVKAFARHRYEISRFADRNDNLRDANLTAMFLMVGVMPIMMFIINMGIVGALWFGGRFVDQGTLEVGGLIAFNNYMVQTMFALMMVSMVAVRFTRAEASAQRVNEVFDQVPEIGSRHDQPAPIRDDRSRGEVRFEDVTFRYSPDSEPVLDDLSFVAEPGSVTAILGTTGSGKSSLVNLIPRFYDVQEGRVLIDGVDVRDVNQEELRDNIAMVLQETVLFSGTIRDNIRFGRPDATEDEILAAAKAAQADPFIQELPEKYDAIVGQRGVNLSGGQKQRMAIARALIRRAPILILDDSTSAVDVATERRIQEALAELDQTTIMVAQRISAVVSADKILVLEDGRLVAEGTHDELLRTSEVYRDIYDSQVESGTAYGAA
jgi:ATP-binding cassette subfamily B protein